MIDFKRAGGKWKTFITTCSVFVPFPLQTEVHSLCYIRWLYPSLKIHLNHKSTAIQSLVIKMRFKIRELTRWVGRITACFPELSFLFSSGAFSEGKKKILHNYRYLDSKAHKNTSTSQKNARICACRSSRERNEEK